jgi:hypothetical protein
MHRSLFSEKEFALSKLPEWTCPSCSAGTLRKVQDDEFRILQNATTQSIVNESFFDHEHDIGVFTGRLFCGNCRENVFVSGTSSTDIEYDEDTGTNYYAVVQPRFFIPTLRLIDVDERVPSRIHQLIDAACSVFWCSGESCINRLRCVTEEILTFLQIPASTDNGAFITLHHRIEKIADEHKNVRDALMAAKHMGNDASHGAFEVTREEVLDAFEVVEYCLAELFPVDRSNVLSIISRINSNKGFRPKDDPK